jgi:hypothetical protein
MKSASWSVLLLMLLAFPTVGSCADQTIRIVSARLLDSTTLVVDGSNSLSVKGYLKLEVESKRDLIALAISRGANLRSLATSCTSKAELDSWPYVYAGTSGPGIFKYVVLVRYKKDDGEHPYDLAKAGSEVCVTIALGSMNPFAAARFRAASYPLDPAVIDALLAYDKQNGDVQLKLSPECAARMCRPSYDH